jgi:osmotically inducible lipoprotein OsmB
MKTLASLASLTLAGIAFILAACGSTTEERAATGAVGGAVVAGPVGAAVGAAGGAAISAATNEPKK